MSSEITSDAALALRPQAEVDRDFLYRLYASTRAAEMALADWSEAQKLEFLQLQFNAQSKHYAEYFPDASFDIIELDGVAIGRLYLDAGEEEFRVIDIALLPEYRGRGIGARYMRDVMRRAADRDACVTIHVEKNNPAMSLYERLGFVPVEDKGVYWFMRWDGDSGQLNTAS